MSFPADFVWGAAASAYQIEGAVRADGRGESIWDRFCATAGKVRNGDDGSVACDFYHRYRADVELMRELGLDAFRLSVAWPRVVPAGRGRVNQAGLDFYDRLVDALLAAGVAPYVNLFHWDLPAPLEDAGGWPVRETVDAFEAYVEAVAGRLGDRVPLWLTHNEPWVAAWLGYGLGLHAPGRADDADALAAAHHLLLSHARAAEVLRREAPAASVGITLDLCPVDPASDSDADTAAAREADGMRNRWFLDPLFRGTYPPDLLDRHPEVLANVRDGDLEAIAAPLDFLGVNYYSRNVVAADGREVRLPGARYTDMGWEIHPEGLARILRRVHDEYGPGRIFVMENGACFSDVRIHDGSVDDPERRDYLESHLTAVEAALAGGIPVAGYFVWSLLDNFEWSLGYQKRFGLVYVDYPTLERVPKLSYRWYRDFIARQRARSEEETAVAS